MNDVLYLSTTQVALSLTYLVILILILYKKRISREKEILMASLRMTLQLILTGYVLVLLFDNMHPLATLAVVFLMEFFAIQTVIKRTKSTLSAALKKVISLSIALGTLTSLFFFMLVIIQIKPWYDPRYFIPLAGMLIGNSMTGISLGVSRLTEGMLSKRLSIETALMLGATPQKACKEILDHAFDSSIMPTINSMVGMGIIFLPGMMTGQILSGTSPLLAIKYQLAIMFGILGSVSFSVLLFVHTGYRTFFNPDAQFLINEQNDPHQT